MYGSVPITGPDCVSHVAAVLVVSADPVPRSMGGRPKSIRHDPVAPEHDVSGDITVRDAGIVGRRRSRRDLLQNVDGFARRRRSNRNRSRSNSPS